MNKTFFFIVTFWLIGIATGWMVSTMAYKPMLISQGIEIAELEEDKLRLIERFKFLKVEIEAHRQDLQQFISKDTLMSVLKQLGIIIE